MDLGGDKEQLLDIYFLTSVCMLNAHPRPSFSSSFSSIYLISLRLNRVLRVVQPQLSKIEDPPPPKLAK